jgi:hypothetical protein
MKKFVVKTVEEFVYDKEGRVIKKTVTEESYEQEIFSGGTIKSDTITADKLKKTTGIIPDPFKVTSVSTVPNSATFVSNGTSEVSVKGDLKVSNKTISDIANEVKAILDKDLKSNGFKFF